MTTRRSAAAFAILIGLSIIGLWTMLFATGQVPEIRTAPVSLTYHLIAELSTAMTLLIGGSGFLRRKAWGASAYLLSMGMLIYASLTAGGYYGQKGEWAMMSMFGAFAVMALVFAALVGFKSYGRA